MNKSEVARTLVVTGLVITRDADRLKKLAKLQESAGMAIDAHLNKSTASLEGKAGFLIVKAGYEIGIIDTSEN